MAEHTDEMTNDHQTQNGNTTELLYLQENNNKLAECQPEPYWETCASCQGSEHMFDPLRLGQSQHQGLWCAQSKELLASLQQGHEGWGLEG